MASWSESKPMSTDYLIYFIAFCIIFASFLIGYKTGSSTSFRKCGNPLHGRWHPTSSSTVKPAKYVSKPFKRAFRKLGAHHLSRICVDCVRTAPSKREFTVFLDETAYSKVSWKANERWPSTVDLEAASVNVGIRPCSTVTPNLVSGNGCSTMTAAECSAAAPTTPHDSKVLKEQFTEATTPSQTTPGSGMEEASQGIHWYWFGVGML
ncbi:uncharacterized protein [Ptychodera flava]|uniref:uncharacterized protein n=1 Tax=Ptychodera flava TaxID=63121 RepID=UPI003969FB94